MSEDRSAQARQAQEEDQDQAHQMARAIAASREIEPVEELPPVEPPEETPPVEPPAEAPTVVDIPALMVNGNIQSTANVGDTLTVTDGNWTGEPTSYSQSWSSNFVEVGTGPSYVVQTSDTGVVCIVTATNSAGSGTATTNPVTVLTTKAS